MVKITQNLEGKVDEDSHKSMDPLDEDEKLYQSVLETSQFFTSIVELLPAKFYLNQEGDDSENIFKPQHGKKRKKKKPVDKKLLAKKAKLLKLDPSQHKTISELQEEVEKKEKELHSNVANNTSSLKPVKVSDVVSTSSLADLHEKLHAKMDQLRGNRKVLTNNNINGATKNGKRKLEKKKINIDKKNKEKESANIKRSNTIEKNAINNNDNIKNDSGEVVFSKFDFATGEARNAEAEKKKDLKQLLNIAERKHDKLKLLEETDSQKADEMKKKISWDNAFQKAEGTKLKDNPKLLKKTIKRKRKQKERSSKTWGERVETVEKQKEEKQKLRKQHLKEKREEKMNKKSGKKKKKKFSPGF